VVSETVKTPTGEHKLVWKRSQREGISPPISLKPGGLRWTPDPELPDVQVQGIVRKQNHFWSITLFLVNGQEEPKKLRDGAWLFQPELIADSPDGKPIFHSRPPRDRQGCGRRIPFR
jgi:hypothetical protein